ncbi:MAG: signal peptidase I [Solobacterium sp.]|nr:signal peptidase I [Solobacterium sp.]
MSRTDYNNTAKGGSILPALCSIIGTGILLCVIILLIPMSTPRLFGYDMYNVVSGSMEPAIPTGSMIFVKPAEAKNIAEGEVIAFYSGGSVVVHRVTNNNTVEGKISTKGDANADEDFNSVLYKEVIGVVKYHVPYLGDVSSNLTSAFGKVYLLALIILGLLFHLLAVRLRALLI